MRRLPQGFGVVDSDSRPELKVGSRGYEVEDLQRLLGFTGKAVDGVFESDTDTALRKFQASSGLAPTGITNGATWDALSATPTGSKPSGRGDVDTVMDPLEIKGRLPSWAVPVGLAALGLVVAVMLLRRKKSSASHSSSRPALAGLRRKARMGLSGSDMELTENAQDEYVATLRNPSKQRYAKAWLLWFRGSGDAEVPRGFHFGVSDVEAQKVRLALGRKRKG